MRNSHALSDKEGLHLSLKRKFYMKKALDIIYLEKSTQFIGEDELKNLEEHYELLMNDQTEISSNFIYFKGLINDALNVVEFLYGVCIEESMLLRKQLDDEGCSLIEADCFDRKANINDLSERSKIILLEILKQTIKLSRKYQDIYKKIKHIVIELFKDEAQIDILNYISLIDRANQIKLAILLPKDISQILSKLPYNLGEKMLSDITDFRAKRSNKSKHPENQSYRFKDLGKSYADAVKQKSELSECNVSQLEHLCYAYNKTYKIKSDIEQVVKKSNRLRRSASICNVASLNNNVLSKIKAPRKISRSLSVSNLSEEIPKKGFTDYVKKIFLRKNKSKNFGDKLNAHHSLRLMKTVNNPFQILAQNNESIQGPDSIQEDLIGEAIELKKDKRKAQNQKRKKEGKTKKKSQSNEAQSKKNDKENKELDEQSALVQKEKEEKEDISSENSASNDAIKATEMYIQMVRDKTREWTKNIVDINLDSVSQVLNDIARLMGRYDFSIKHDKKSEDRLKKYNKIKRNLKLFYELILNRIIPDMIAKRIELLCCNEVNIIDLDVCHMHILFRINIALITYQLAHKIMPIYFTYHAKFLKAIMIYKEVSVYHNKNDSDSFYKALNNHFIFLFNMLVLHRSLHRTDIDLEAKINRSIHEININSETDFNRNLHQSDVDSMKNPSPHDFLIAFNNYARQCDIELIKKMNLLEAFELSKERFILILNCSISYETHALSYFLQKVHVELCFENYIHPLFNKTDVAKVFEKNNIKSILNYIRLIKLCYKKLTNEELINFFELLGKFLNCLDGNDIYIHHDLKDLFYDEKLLLDLSLYNGKTIRNNQNYKILFDEMEEEVKFRKRFSGKIYFSVEKINTNDAKKLYELKYDDLKKIGVQAQFAIMGNMFRESINYKAYITDELKETLCNILVNAIKKIGPEKTTQLLLRYELFDENHHISIMHLIVSDHANELVYLELLQFFIRPELMLLLTKSSNKADDTPLHLALRHKNYTLAVTFLASAALLLEPNKKGVTCAQLLFHPDYRDNDSEEFFEFIDVFIPSYIEKIRHVDNAVSQKTYKEIMRLIELEDSEKCTLLECLVKRKREIAVTYFLTIGSACYKSQKRTSIYEIAKKNKCLLVVSYFEKSKLYLLNENTMFFKPVKPEPVSTELENTDESKCVTQIR